MGDGGLGDPAHGGPSSDNSVEGSTEISCAHGDRGGICFSKGFPVRKQAGWRVAVWALGDPILEGNRAGDREETVDSRTLR